MNVLFGSSLFNLFFSLYKISILWCIFHFAATSIDLISLFLKLPCILQPPIPFPFPSNICEVLHVLSLIPKFIKKFITIILYEYIIITFSIANHFVTVCLVALLFIAYMTSKSSPMVHLIHQLK